MFSVAHVTTPILWICTGILWLLDTVLILIARRLISRDQFRQVRLSGDTVMPTIYACAG